MGTADNTQLMQSICTEMAQRNVDPFLEHIAEDMRWTVIGTTTWSGTRTGKQAVLDTLLSPLTAALDGPIRVTAHNFIAEGDSGVVEGRGQAMTKTGKPYHNTYGVVFRLANGQVQTLTEYLDTEVITAAFGQ
jgi:ketosteroid isomerase-like protein